LPGSADFGACACGSGELRGHRGILREEIAHTVERVDFSFFNGLNAGSLLP
jgi:hypothetical protein